MKYKKYWTLIDLLHQNLITKYCLITKKLRDSISCIIKPVDSYIEVDIKEARPFYLDEYVVARLNS